MSLNQPPFLKTSSSHSCEWKSLQSPLQWFEHFQRLSIDFPSFCGAAASTGSLKQSDSRFSLSVSPACQNVPAITHLTPQKSEVGTDRGSLKTHTHMYFYTTQLLLQLCVEDSLRDALLTLKTQLSLSFSNFSFLENLKTQLKREEFCCDLGTNCHWWNLFSLLLKMKPDLHLCALMGA